MTFFIDNVQLKQDVYQNVDDVETITITIQVPTLELICKSYEPSKKSRKKRKIEAKNVDTGCHVACLEWSSERRLPRGKSIGRQLKRCSQAIAAAHCAGGQLCNLPPIKPPNFINCCKMPHENCELSTAQSATGPWECHASIPYQRREKETMGEWAL